MVTLIRDSQVIRATGCQILIVTSRSVIVCVYTHMRFIISYDYINLTFEVLEVTGGQIEVTGDQFFMIIT